MNIREALICGANELQHIMGRKLEVRILMCYVLSITPEDMLMNYSSIISPQSFHHFMALIARRARYEPIAYITGKKEFYGLELIVNKNVLIPRPETELLIDYMRSNYAHDSDALDEQVIDILELGTGSGAISVALASEIPNSKITAIDICSRALNVAKANATLHNVQDNITFVQSDWYENISRNIKYDYIITNPPYISKSDKSFISQETYLFEPDIALYANKDGSSDYDIIIGSAASYLKDDGKILCEIGFNQKDVVSQMLRNACFNKLHALQDLAKHDRVMIGQIT